jgi:hypothetical protein
MALSGGFGNISPVANTGTVPHTRHIKMRIKADGRFNVIPRMK